MRWLLHALKTVATWLLALLVLFEEWGWEPLARLLGQLAKLPLIGWLEQRVARLVAGDSTAKRRDLQFDAPLRKALEVMEKGQSQRDLFTIAAASRLSLAPTASAP